MSSLDIGMKNGGMCYLLLGNMGVSGSGQFNFSRVYSTTSPIIEYKGNKNVVVHVSFNIAYFFNPTIYFSNFLLSHIKMSFDSIYTVYIKVKYRDVFYFMAGNQFGWCYLSDESLEELQKDIKAILLPYLDKYKLSHDDIDFVQVSFRPLDRMVYSELLINKDVLDHLPIKEVKTTMNYISIPTTIEAIDLGKPLPIVYDSSDSIKQVLVNIKGIECNFLDLIRTKAKYIRKNHRDSITQFDKDCVFYYIKSDIDYILVIKKFVNRVEKFKYSTTGILITRVVDRWDGDVLIRSEGSYRTYIKDSNVVYSSNSIALRPLDIKFVVNKDSWLPDTNIGAIDVETYRNNNNVNEIYAIGFKTKLESEPVVYYISNNYNSSELVLAVIRELLRPKYSGIAFYCHNFSGYDVIFIYTLLLKHNDANNNEFTIKPTLRDSRIIKLIIIKDNNKLTILDSLCVLDRKLAKLADDFGVKTQKTIFPYKFSTHNHLWYKGHTPGIHFYENISIKEYQGFYEENWSFKDETLKYLSNDLNCLYEVLIKANNQIYADYKLNLMDGLTISSLAMKLFIRRYYEDNIPNINKLSIYKDIRQAFYGGMTEVYRPYGEDLYYYDVNSLYPYSSLNDMPGLISEKITFYNEKTDISNLFGFFNCIIEAPLDGYIGLLPIKRDGTIELPVGTWEGWYFSEELKFAKLNGYKITVLNGYKFNKQKNVFRNYTQYLYKIKANSKNDTQRFMAKSFLNNLIGRFGINLEKGITDLMSQEVFREKSLMYPILSYVELYNDKVLVNYIPILGII